MIGNKAFLEAIEKGIAEKGIFLVAVGDVGECAACGGDACGCAGREFGEMKDGFVYTIGHRKLGRPDMVFLCGPRPGEEAFSARELREEMMDCAGTCNWLSANWEKAPLLEGQTVMTAGGRIYLASAREELVAGAKEGITVQAGNYYGDSDYGLLALVPVGRGRHPDEEDV